MTAATLSRLPLSAGGALAGSVARGGLWGIALMIDGAYWVAGRFMRAPIAYSCVIAIVGFSALAGSNALFLQTARHPAPLFFSNPKLTNPSTTKPVIPATRPRPAAAIDNETTGSVGGQVATDSIGNDDVMVLQKKLAALDLFEGTADGLFGRRTASAIKAFEIKSGMKPSGKLTRKLLNAVAEAAIPAVVPLPAAEPLPKPAATVAAIVAPKPQPAPVLAQPVATTMVAVTDPSKPVPLAPTRRTVQTLQVTSAGPASAADTFAANSVPEAAPATAPQQLAMATPQDAQTAAPAAQPVAVAPAIAAEAPAAQPSPLETAPVQQVASLEPAAQTPTDTPTASDASVMAMNNVPADPTPVAVATPAPTTTAALDPSATPAQRLAAQMGTLPPEATAASAIAPATVSSDPGDGIGSTDPVLITKIQRALASLGFLGAKIDGVPGEGTAKAIRNFEVFYDYRVTGLATPQLLNLLIQHGAVI